MIFVVARLAAVLGHAHAVVEHLSGRARAHFRRQALARRFPGPQRFVVVTRLFAAGRTSFVQQSWEKNLSGAESVRIGDI